MKVILAATVGKRSGGTFYARRLGQALGAEMVPIDQPLTRLVPSLLRVEADVFLIDFEYATFGNAARSIVLLPLLVLLLRLRRPVVVRLHGVVTESSLRGGKFRHLVLSAFHLSYKLTAVFASAFIVHSELMRTTLATEYGIVNATVIPLGSNPAASRRSEGAHLAFFGFVRPSKGVEEAILALGLLREEYPDLRLVVAGGLALDREATYLGVLQDAVRTAGVEDRVEFLTRFLTEEEKTAVVASASMLLLPYKDEFVEVSAVVHDFAGYGVPIICSDRPRFSELTDGVNCLKVRPEGPALAQAIRTLLENPPLAARLGENLRHLAEANSWDRVATLHRAYLESVVQGQGRPPS